MTTRFVMMGVRQAGRGDLQIMNEYLNKERLKQVRQIGRSIGIVFIFVLLIMMVIIPAFQWIIDYIWMDTLGFGSVYTTILTSKIVLALSGFALFFAAIFFTLTWIRKTYLNHFDKHQLPPLVLNNKASFFTIVILAILSGFIGSFIVQGIGWEPALKFLHHESFGVTDPYFSKDISFYMFILPFLKFIIFILIGLSILNLLIIIGAYSVFHIYRLSRMAQIHLIIMISLIGVLLASLHVLAPFETLLTNRVNIAQTSVVHGLSFTDKIINIPKAYILAAAAIGATIWMIVNFLRHKLEQIVIPIIVYFALVIIGQGAAVIVQNFIVSPNEFARETEYLQHNLDYTKQAYQLHDIEEKEHPGNDTLDEAMIKRNELTINNVRINDTRPLLDIYNQLQTIRTYYKFNDMDIDRYYIDGDYEQVFIGARELSMEHLPEQAQTWVNRKLRYTHGYGVAMSHVNTVTKQGQPEYMVQNIPAEGKIDITRPQIYFGEEQYPNVIVSTKVDEFDYPTGDDNETHRFEEETGIPLQGLKKWLFAINEKSFRMIVSDQLTKESQLLDTRNIMDRVKRIAPFFEYDSDPYIVIRDDGTLVWIIDAYLTAERYPYSEAYSKNKSYIRNSIKVAVDAYSGEVHFYVADPDDPLLHTYQNIFPDLFTDEVPEDIKSHFRYPENLFTIQAKMYGTYHMANLEVFYNREDYWEIPTEKYFNEDIEMEPYYITMMLPDETEEEFILMVPFTPKKRQNMIAWMGVRNDGDNYGELFVYRFPKQKNIYGPQQIENRINQDSYISQQLNLWGQGGSKVIRGNLLAIPIEDTILYVEPIYIESANETSLPEVKQVVMAYGEHIVMEESFEKSLEKILQLIERSGDTSLGEDLTDDEIDDEQDVETSPSEPLIEAEELLFEIAQMFDEYKDLLADGDWEEAAKVFADIERYLEMIE